MSEENVEIVRKVYEAVARGEADTVLSFYDTDIEWDVSQSPYRAVVGRDTYRGHDGLRKFFDDYRDPWRFIEDDCENLLDAGDRVVSVVSTRARGKASGVDVEATYQAGVWTLRKGKIVHVTWFAYRRGRRILLHSPILTQPSKPPGCRSQTASRSTIRGW